MLDQKPVGALFAVSLAHPGQNPAAIEFFTLESEIQLALCIASLGILTVPVSAIPDHDGTSAVLALWNGAFEVAVIQWMILDLDGEPLVMRIEGRSLGDSPGFEDAIQFQSQIIVQVQCRMLLNHESEALRRLDLSTSAGFGRLGEIAFGSLSCKQLLDHAGTVEIGERRNGKFPRRLKFHPTGGSKWRLVPIGMAHLSSRSSPARFPSTQPRPRPRRPIFIRSTPRPATG